MATLTEVLQSSMLLHKAPLGVLPLNTSLKMLSKAPLWYFRKFHLGVFHTYIQVTDFSQIARHGQDSLGAVLRGAF